MRSRSHLVGGFCSNLIVTTIIFGEITNASTLSVCAMTGMSLLGSIFPDIDHPNSKISHKLPLISTLVSLFLLILKNITKFILLFAFWLPKSKKDLILSEFEHRGIFHSLLFCLLIPLIFYLFPITSSMRLNLQLSFFGGYLSHLMMDMMTVSGVKILIPITFRSFRILKLKTGKFIDELLAKVIVIVLTIIILVIYYYFNLYS